MSPATPSRQDRNHSSLVGTSPAVLSTPQSLGSAARGKDLATTGVLEYVVRPWIARDLENAQESPVDDMLRSFLTDCMTDKPNTTGAAQTVFDSSLETVRLFCNEKQNLFISKIKARLEHYSTIKSEVALYPAFVEAANAAFRCLQNIAIEGLREASEELVFHVNGLQMKQDHQNQESVRKPDVVLVSTADATCKDTTGRDVSEIAIKKPEENFKWRNVRTVVEFKTGPAKPPPAEYHDDSHLTNKLANRYLKSRQNNGAVTTPSATNSQQELETQTGSFSDKVATSSTTTSARSEKRKGAPELELNQGSEPRSSKRVKVGIDENEDDKNKRTPYTQIGVYGAEMFASHAGRVHVISLIVIGEILYIWRFDREGTIQCSALNFIQDLPRFLLLLLAMQRFDNENWGLHRDIDPDFGDLPQDSADSPPYRKMIIEDSNVGPVDIKLDMSPETRIMHYGLNGRATSVFDIVSEKLGSNVALVAKLYWAETSRKSEQDILKKVYEIAKKEVDVEGHVPQMVYSHIFWDTCTLNFRKRLGIESKGARTLCLIVFQKLMPITKLVGDEFLKCWWDTVKCHVALWKNGVYHRDVSASNLMYRREGNKAIGVLNDFDLSTMQQGGTGNERTGTLPFMARALLDPEALAGNIPHVYAHDAESFVWVLTWITLRYENGKLRMPPHRYLDAWLQVGADGCLEKKSAFLVRVGEHPMAPGKDHERNWQVAYACLRSLHKSTFDNGSKYAIPVGSKKLVTEDGWEKPFRDILRCPVDEVKDLYKSFPI